MQFDLVKGPIEAEAVTLRGFDYMVVELGGRAHCVAEDVFDLFVERQLTPNSVAVLEGNLPLPDPRLVDAVVKSFRRNGEPKVARSVKAAPKAVDEPAPADAKAQTFNDTLRCTLASIGPATVQEIADDLTESGVPFKKERIYIALHGLKKQGDVFKDAAGRWHRVEE